MPLQTVPLKEIHTGERFRKEYHDLESLCASIENFGLIQPIAILSRKGVDKAHFKLPRGKKYLLLAGGRRFAAMSVLAEMGKAKEVDCRVYDDNQSADESREIELIENIEREDLTWQETAALTKEIHELQIAKYGEKSGRTSNIGGANAQTTGELIGKSGMTVGRHLKAAEVIEAHPEIAEKAQSANEALKMARVIESEMIRRELAKRAEAKVQKNPESTMAQMIKAYQLGDCLEAMASMKANSISFVDVDPPYGVNMKEVKKTRPNLAAFEDIDAEDFLPFMEKVFVALYRIMKIHSWGVLWFEPDPWYAPLVAALRFAGFTCNGRPLVWNKTWGHGENLDYNLTNAHELALYFRKGAPVVQQQGTPNVFTYGNVRSQRIHPTEKPVQLLEAILEAFAPPNVQAYSPFLGSGNFLIAAREAGVIATGNDIKQKYRDSYITRLKDNYVEELTEEDIN